MCTYIHASVWVLIVSCSVLRVAAVEAAACADICYTVELTGFGPGGVPGCSCSGSEAGARTGAGDCNCGQCYTKTQGTIYGFAISADGTCQYGTDCGNCDYSSGSSASATAATSSKPVTSTPSLVPATSQPSTSTGKLSKRTSMLHSFRAKC